MDTTQPPDIDAVISASDDFRQAAHHLVQEVIRQIYHVSGNEVSIYRMFSQHFLAMAGVEVNVAPDVAGPVLMREIDAAVTEEIDSFVKFHVAPIFMAATEKDALAKRGIVLLDASHRADAGVPENALTAQNLAALTETTASLRNLANDLEQDFARRLARLEERTEDSPVPYTAYRAYRTTPDSQARIGWEERFQRALPLFPRLAVIAHREPAQELNL